MSAFFIFKDGSSRIWTEAEMRSDACRGVAPDTVVVMEPFDEYILKTCILPFVNIDGFELFVMRGVSVLPVIASEPETTQARLQMMRRVPSSL